MYVYMLMHTISVYVRDQLKTWAILKSSDDFKAGRTALKRARRLRNGPDGFQSDGIITDGFEAGRPVSQLTVNYKRLLDGLKIGCRHSRTHPAGLELCETVVLGARL